MGRSSRAKVAIRDRKRYARARARGAAQLADRSRVVRALYDASRDGVDIAFAGGGSIVIPRGMIPGLQGASMSTATAIQVSPAGDALSWPALDIHVHVAGLVERAFGNRLFAAATGRRGGCRRSKAKAAAA